MDTEAPRGKVVCQRTAELADNRAETRTQELWYQPGTLPLFLGTLANRQKHKSAVYYLKV